jgi:hypothetical protein
MFNDPLGRCFDFEFPRISNVVSRKFVKQLCHPGRSEAEWRDLAFQGVPSALAGLISAGYFWDGILADKYLRLT